MQYLLLIYRSEAELSKMTPAGARLRVRPRPRVCNAATRGEAPVPLEDEWRAS